MSERTDRRAKRLVLASWVLIWLGAILAVNPQEALSRSGAVLWGAGMVIQMGIVARRLPAMRAAP
jgi:hypothetical protein